MNNEKPKGNPSDHLANERTFLARIRTSIALMGFGFVVVKFSLFVKQFSLVMAGHQSIASTGFSGVVGICLVGVGAGAALVGYWRYKRTERQLLDQAFVQRSGWLVAFTIGVIAASLLLLYYLLPNL